LSDGALMRIAMDRAELTPEALAALEAQLAARGLREVEVAGLRRYLSRRGRTRGVAARKEQELGLGDQVRTGKRFYGKRDLVEMRGREQYQATLWFTVLWVPLSRWDVRCPSRPVSWWQSSADSARPAAPLPLDLEAGRETWAVAAVAVAAVYF